MAFWRYGNGNISVLTFTNINPAYLIVYSGALCCPWQCYKAPGLRIMHSNVAVIKSLLFNDVYHFAWCPLSRILTKQYVPVQSCWHCQFTTLFNWDSPYEKQQSSTKTYYRQCAESAKIAELKMDETGSLKYKNFLTTWLINV
jgi:hypothetical protein